MEDTDGAAAYTYRLVSGPTNMTVDANTGLVQWTPTVEQVGVACVRLQVEESTPDKGCPEGGSGCLGAPPGCGRVDPCDRAGLLGAVNIYNLYTFFSWRG